MDTSDHVSIKICYQYRDPHYKNKTVSWLSYIYNGNNYIGKDSLYIETGRNSPMYPQRYYLFHRKLFTMTFHPKTSRWLNMLETSFQIDIWCHKMSVAKDDIHNYQLNYGDHQGSSSCWWSKYAHNSLKYVSQISAESTHYLFSNLLELRGWG